jgi:bifunctional non-homologous end joining protein LigD
MAARKPEADSLVRYREKRDFSRTPEPSGAETVPETVRPAGEGFFVVQKHAARRLHYDFRLALGGVLKSWAVAKGPSLDPHDRRLAVEVEDHPVAYGDFEGVIPKGQYGGGTVMLWDHGKWEPAGDPAEGLAKGNLKFKLSGQRLKGGWALVRMGGKAANEKHPNWLLIKERDDEARDGGVPLIEQATDSVSTHRSMEDIAADPDRVWQSNRPADEQDPAKPKAPKPRGRSPLPDFVPPQLAARVKNPPSGAEWLHEIKFDGYRLLARIDGGEVRLLTRRGHDWSSRFKPIAQALAKLGAAQALIDGEAVVLTDSGVSDFGRLQATLAGEARHRLSFEAFDLLHLDGEDLTGRPLAERKALLQTLIAGLEGQSTILYSDHVEALGEHVFAHACQLALEGVISKRRDLPYRSGRSDGWVKSKCIERQEFVIGGYARSTAAGKGLGSLLLGWFEDGALRYAGRVGTGFTGESSNAIRARLDGLKRETPPFAKRPAGAGRDVVWVEPELVCEVEFLTWTEDGLLRHASFKGLREDKPAQEVTIERPPAEPAAPKQAAKPRGKRAMEKATEATLDSVELTHPERVLDPESGLTKRGLAEYLALVAERMLPHIAGRPISFVRCPGGTAKACFYQKHSESKLPPGIGSVTIREKAGTGEYLTIDSARGLIGLAQMGVLEIHPWGSRAEDIEKPDRLIFDFDPDPSVSFAWVVEAALVMRARLETLGLKSFVKTTGGKGLHVVAPIAPEREWPAIKELARAIAVATAADSDRYVTTMTKAKRTGKIFIDFFRNDRGATAVAPYSTRARPGAPVATPIAWDEATPSLTPGHFTVATIPRRLAQLRADPWAEMPDCRQSADKALKAMRIG